MTPSANGHSNGQAAPRSPQTRALGGWTDPILLRQMRAFVQQIVTNEMTSLSRQTLAAQADRTRNINFECHYPDSGSITPDLYKELYLRDAVAGRVVELYPKECWQSPPTVYEDESTADVTEFEEAWDNLGRGLLDGSGYYQDEAGSPIWAHLLNADILSGVGQFGVILLGLDDGRNLQDPVEGSVTVNHRDSPPPRPQDLANNQYARVYDALVPERVKALYREEYLPRQTKLEAAWHRTAYSLLDAGLLVNQAVTPAMPAPVLVANYGESQARLILNANKPKPKWSPASPFPQHPGDTASGEEQDALPTPRTVRPVDDDPQQVTDPGQPQPTQPPSDSRPKTPTPDQPPLVKLHATPGDLSQPPAPPPTVTVPPNDMGSQTPPLNDFPHATPTRSTTPAGVPETGQAPAEDGAATQPGQREHDYAPPPQDSTGSGLPGMRAVGGGPPAGAPDPTDPSRRQADPQYPPQQPSTVGGQPGMIGVPSSAPFVQGVYGTEANYQDSQGLGMARPAGADLSGTDQQYFGVQFGPSQFPAEGASKVRRQLKFIQSFDESLVQVVRYEWNIRNPRFGMPVMYRITLNDPASGQPGGVGLPLATVYVHWTRVIHLADTHHSAASSRIFGAPRLRPVLNHILNLQKIYGADGEAYWQGAFIQKYFKTQPSLGGDVAINMPGLKNMEEAILQGTQKYGALMGLDVQTVAPAVADPTPHVAVQLEAVAIKMACPVRVLKGSERGELASSQDDEAWNERKTERNNSYTTPKIIIVFVDRLILLGVLPEPNRKVVATAPPQQNPTVAPPAQPGMGGPPGAGGAGKGGVPGLPGGKFGASPPKPGAEGKEGEGEPPGGKPNPFAKGGPTKSPPPPPIDNRYHFRRYDYVHDKRTRRPVGIRVPNPAVRNSSGRAAGVSALIVACDRRGRMVFNLSGLPKVVGVETAGGYSVRWPTLDSLGEKDKVAIALQKTQAIGAYIQGNCEAMITPVDWWVRIMGEPEEEAQEIVDAVLANHQTQMTMPAPGEDGHPATPPPEQPEFGGFVDENGNPLPPDEEGDDEGGDSDFPPDDGGGPDYGAAEGMYDDEPPTGNEKTYNSFDPGQERDDRGRWVGGGGGWGSLSQSDQSGLVGQAEGLSDGDRSVIESYQTDGSFDVINHYARTGRFEPKDLADQADDLFQGGFGEDARGFADQQISDLDRIVGGSRLPAAVTVYRGVGRGVYDELREGDAVTDKGFISTSLNPAEAEGFSEAGGAVVRLHLSKGAKGLYVDSVVDLGQKEVLLPRGQKFTVRSVTEKGGRRYVDLEPAGRHPAPKAKLLAKTSAGTDVPLTGKRVRLGSADLPKGYEGYASKAARVLADDRADSGMIHLHFKDGTQLWVKGVRASVVNEQVCNAAYLGGEGAGGDSEDCEWRTISGAHVCITHGGNIAKGPPHLTGKHRSALGAGGGKAPDHSDPNAPAAHPHDHVPPEHGKGHDHDEHGHGHDEAAHSLEHTAHDIHHAHEGLEVAEGLGHAASAGRGAAHGAEAAHGAAGAGHGGLGHVGGEVAGIVARNLYPKAVKAVTDLLERGGPRAKRLAGVITDVHEKAGRINDRVAQKLAKRYGPATAAAIMGAGALAGEHALSAVGVPGPLAKVVPFRGLIGAAPFVAMAEAGKRLGVVGPGTKSERGLKMAGTWVHAVRAAVGKAAKGVADSFHEAAHETGKMLKEGFGGGKGGHGLSKRVTVKNERGEDVEVEVVANAGDDAEAGDGSGQPPEELTLSSEEIQAAAREALAEVMAELGPDIRRAMQAVDEYEAAGPDDDAPDDGDEDNEGEEPPSSDEDEDREGDVTGNERRGGSFFAECKRDELGRCLPAGEGGGVKVATPDALKKAQALAQAKGKAAPKPTDDEVAHNQAGIARLGANKFRRGLVGSATQRRDRTDALVEEFGGPGAKSCPCFYCGTHVSRDGAEPGTLTLEQDKIHTTAEGGRYRLSNLVPSCRGCNGQRGDVPWKKIKFPS